MTSPAEPLTADGTGIAPPVAPIADAAASVEAETTGSLPERVYRHKLPVRMWHWINAIAIVTLFMSGLMIFNAHPRAYWGHYGANAAGAPDPAWIEIGPNAAGSGEIRFPGVGLTIPTDGVFGRAEDGDGVSRNRAFPYWLTLPQTYELAAARGLHFFAAWWFGIGFLLFFLWAIFSRHASRDLTPKLKELSPKHLLHEVVEHAQLKFPTGLAAAQFNTLQRISYFVVILIFVPTMILTGLCMSPAMDAAAPWLVDLFGGRQSARSIHFIVCWALFGFVIVHLIMVVLAGPVNEIRSMVTGWFKLPPERKPRDEIGADVEGAAA
jgi:Ni/Fe-hydrogenase b-type cytochrome subunit